MNILWFGKTGEANAWYHITLTAASPVVENVYVVRWKKPIRRIQSDKITFFETEEANSALMSALKLWKRASRVLQTNAIDAIITFNVFPYGALAHLLAVLHGKRLILCFIGKDYNYYLHRQPYRSIIKLALQRADLVICKGQYMAEGLVRLGIEELKCGSYPHFVSGEFLAEWDEEGACYDIVNVCEFIPRKRVDVLIRALNVLKREGCVLTACLVGEGPEKNKIIQLSQELGVRSQITFAGFQSDVFQYLIRGKLFVQTSSGEGLSLSLLESIAAGLVPVCTNAGAEREIIEHDVNGLFSEIGDHEVLAQRLTYAISPDVYRRLRKNVLAMRGQLRIEKAAIEMSCMLRKVKVDQKGRHELVP